MSRLVPLALALLLVAIGAYALLGGATPRTEPTEAGPGSAPPVASLPPSAVAPGSAPEIPTAVPAPASPASLEGVAAPPAAGASVKVVGGGPGPTEVSGDGSGPTGKKPSTRYGEWDFARGLPDGWTAAGEAQRLFAPMKEALDAKGKPLTSQAFREVLREHRGQGLEALKEAGALASAGYRHEADDLLAAWNSLYGSYQQQAAQSAAGR